MSTSAPTATPEASATPSVPVESTAPVAAAPAITPPPSAPPAGEDKSAPAASAKTKEAHDIIMKRVYWAMGAGLVPVPFVDMAAVAGVQLKLLEDLSCLYGLDFSQERGQKVIAVLTSSVGANAVGSMLKIIPGVGSIGGAAVAGASTYALGRVFVQHFEDGGNLLDFETEKAKEYFGKAYAEGKKIVADLKNSVTGKN